MNCAKSATGNREQQKGENEKSRHCGWFGGSNVKNKLIGFIPTIPLILGLSLRVLKIWEIYKTEMIVLCHYVLSP